VATVAIGNATNAALLAIRVLATTDEELRGRLERYQADLAAAVRARDDAVRGRA
jgi:5-(carboxyamino)imidazole ribonucleotide mutase